MINTQEKIKIELKEKSLVVEYLPATDRTLYDICDLNGRIVQTGDISGLRTIVDTSALSPGSYILLILDGEMVTSRKFEI